ncbi:MAG: BatD family protein [Verrucomicrobiae bacterium]|nr:BatD family protein [Verrucomicrobiae bacterium]
MKPVTFIILATVLPMALSAAPAVKLDVPKTAAWTGQSLPFFIELQAPGSFTGTPSFDLPQIPGTVILKLGSPVLGSSTDGDTEVFTQRHEFALFSQARGSVELPPITVRFSHRKGYTGPSFDETSQTDSAALSIQRPPGSEDLGFLVTTGSLIIDETWDPRPGSVKTGAVFKRTIVQRAEGMSGMALAPAPDTGPVGIRVYTADPEINDRIDRGSFSGERRETLTYLVQQAGQHTLPAIRYVWWNPETKTLETKTLPEVSFSATAPPVPPEKPSPARFLWWLLPVAACGAALRFRKPIAALARRTHDAIDPPARRADRAFLRACSENDAPAAARAWATRRVMHPEPRTDDWVDRELGVLHRQLYGRDVDATWSGRALADAYRRTRRQTEAAPAPDALPPINP